MAQRQTAAREVEGFRHFEARRKNNPPAGIASTREVRERQTRSYAYDLHLDPQLVWTGKAEHTSFEVDVVSLHVHERVSAKAILDAVINGWPATVGQRRLFTFGTTQYSLV